MLHFRNQIHLEVLSWLAAFLFLLAIALFFDAHEALDALFRSHETFEFDEIVTALAIAGVLGLLYSVLRLKDLAREANRRLAAEEMIGWAAFHDCLTGLPNRRMLNAEAAGLSDAEWGYHRFTAYSIDLDGLNKVNDNLGHLRGDAVLKAIAGRLSQLQDDSVFHLGGDRFLVLSKDPIFSDQQAHCRRILKAIGRPIAIDGIEIEIAASLGYAVFPDDAADLQTLVRSAESAMYAAKKTGQNVFGAFSSSMEVAVRNRLQMEADLKLAIRANVIVPHYQPLVDLKTRQIIGYEALARWEISPGVFVPPCDFIPIAEETGLIFDLTHRLLARACRDAMDWPAHVSLSFNISAAQLSDRLLGLKIIKALSETGLPAHRLEIEVTESAIIQDAESAQFVLASLDRAGIRIALDDFGTGHSSLSQLSSYPFHKIKIDRSFVTSFEHCEKQSKIVHAIIALGSSLGMKVTAEGIESESALSKLEALGCDIGQGYLLGRPVSANALNSSEIPLARHFPA